MPAYGRLPYDEDPDHQLRIDRRATHRRIMRCQFTAKPGQIESGGDLPHKARTWVVLVSAPVAGWCSPVQPPLPRVGRTIINPATVALIATAANCAVEAGSGCSAASVVPGLPSTAIGSGLPISDDPAHPLGMGDTRHGGKFY
jgi:hypothetical protein